MYRTIVRRLVRRAFAGLGENRFARHVDRFADGGILRVHSGGVTRTYTGSEQLKDAFHHLGQSCMEGPFDLTDTWVRGWPWDTRVAVAWKRSRAAEGRPSTVYGMNRIRLGHKGVNSTFKITATAQPPLT